MTQPRTVKLSELLELAERCERATGPDRELDCLIFEMRHLLLKPNHRGTIDGEPTGEYFDQSGNQLPERAPFFTASIDAAMTLVPKGFAWMIGCAPGEGFFATLSTTDEAIDGGAPNIDVDNIIAATPALALCAASLRAIATTTSPTPLKAGG